MTLALGPRQLHAIRSATATVNVQVGAIRSGKTVTAALGFLLYAATAPHTGSLIIVARTREAAWRNIITATLQNPDVVGPAASAVVGNYGAPLVHILGRPVHVLGASDVKAEQAIRGLTVLGALVDEVTVMPQGFFVQLLGRMSPAGARAYVTTNPDGPRHWFKTQYLDRMHPHGPVHGWTLHTSTMDDNPSLTDAYRARVKAEFTGLWYERFILGRWVAGEGSIFSMFDVDRHVIPWAAMHGPLEVTHLLGVGLDHGTTNPTAACVLGMTADGRLIVVDEWRHDPARTGVRLTDAQQSAALREWIPGPHTPNPLPAARITFVDPAAASMQLALMRDGIRTAPAQNQVAFGLSTLASLFAEGNLLVSDRCVGLLDELPAYAWDPIASSKGDDAPMKVNDHSCFVAGTMVTTARGDVAIERVALGDLVLTRGGWRPVTDAGMTCASAPTVTAHLSDGRTLTGTGNHPVWTTTRGWVDLSNLTTCDTMITCPPQPQSSSTASPTPATPTPPTTPPATTTRPGSAVTAACTATSGPTITAPSPRAGTSTTSTTTPRTTTSATSKPCPPPTTSPTTAPLSPQTSAPPSPLASPRISTSPGPGTPHPRGRHGTPSAAGSTGRTASTESRRATSAAVSTPPGTSSPAGSAPAPVGPRPAGPAGSTTQTTSASGAQEPSAPTATRADGSATVRALRVTESQPQPVFNLTVSEHHEFYAAGVLVSNCDALRYAVVSTEGQWRRTVDTRALTVGSRP